MDSFFLLLLCFISIAKSESTEYFVIPNERSYSYCPGWPCLTIDQLSDHFSNSSEVRNTTFNFLPGSYVLTKPVYVYDAINVSFYGDNTTISWGQSHYDCPEQSRECISVYDPQLEAFQEWCCSMFRLTNASYVIITDIILIQVEDHNISGITIECSYDILVQNSHFVGKQAIRNVALIIYSNNKNIFARNVAIFRMEMGVLIVDTVVIKFENIWIEASGKIGIYAYNISDITLKELTLRDNSIYGLYLVLSNNIVMEEIDSSLDKNGVFLLECTKVAICFLSVSQCQEKALLLHFNGYIDIREVRINNASMVEIKKCYLLIVTNMTVFNTSFSLLMSTNVNINFFNITKSDNGLKIDNCTHVKMSEIVTKRNFIGVNVDKSHNLLFKSMILELNDQDGLHLTDCTFIDIFNVTARNNQWSGLGIQSSSNITVMNALVVDNSYEGMSLIDCKNATIYNTAVDNNGLYGLQVHSSNNLEVVHLNATINGILVLECKNVFLSNVHIVSINVHGVFFLHCVSISLKNSTFIDIEHVIQAQQDTGFKSAAIVISHNTSLQIIDCQFIGNHVSSLDVSDTRVKMEGNNLFENISSELGAAFMLSGNTQLIILEDCDIVFRNNYVTEYGGAIHIVTDEITDTSSRIEDIIYRLPGFSVTTRTQCFLRVEGERTNTARLTFINNTAEKGGDVLYGGLVATGYDGDWNCLLSFKNISDMAMQSSEQPFRRITSDPSRVCICGEEGPDCLTVVDPVHHSVYPGQTLTLSAAVVGQDFGTVTGYVYAQFLKPSPHVVEQDQQWIYFSNAAGCQEFRYTINSPCEDCETVLVLTTDRDRIVDYIDQDINHKLSMAWSLLMSEPNYRKQAHDYIHTLVYYDYESQSWFFTDNHDQVVNNTIRDFYKITTIDEEITTNDEEYDNAKFLFPQEIYEYPLYFSINVQKCPFGFSLFNSGCDCSSVLQKMHSVTCDIETQTVSHRGSVWVGIYGNDSLAVSDYCPLNYCKKESVQVCLNSSDTDSQCNYMHSGVLCGGCQTGLSLALGSDQCLHCSNHYLFLMLAFALAGVAFVLVIKFLDLTVRQGTINGLIFYANVIGANKHLFYNQKPINPLTLFIAWFNLDLGIETCLYDGLTAYSRTWLQFVFPIYLWSIVGAIIIIAKYSRRMSEFSGNNGVPVLATLFLLSYTKLLNIIISALSYTTLSTFSGTKYVWSIDGNIEYMSYRHLPLFVVAVLVLVFLWLPYTVLLLTGKYLHKFNFKIIAQNLLRLKPFLDANYAPLDDRHQYWFGVTLAVKAAVLLASRTLPTDSAVIVVFSIMVVSVMLLFWGQLVYKNRALSLLHTSYFMNLAILNATKLLTFEGHISTASFTLIAVSITIFLGYRLHKILKVIVPKLKCKWKILENKCEVTEHEHIEMAEVIHDSSEDSSEDSNEDIEI